MDADVAAFAEKCCGALEDLQLSSAHITDRALAALAQHCPNLQRLHVQGVLLTSAALLALSERDLPLDKLQVVPWIPTIPNADLVARSAHALSRIRELDTSVLLSHYSTSAALLLCPRLTGARRLCLNSCEDAALLPLLSCTSLQMLAVYDGSSTTAHQLHALLANNITLRSVCIRSSDLVTDAVLGQVAECCPALQELTLRSAQPSSLSDIGLLVLSKACRQLLRLDINGDECEFTESALRGLAQYCPSSAP